MSGQLGAAGLDRGHKRGIYIITVLGGGPGTAVDEGQIQATDAGIAVCEGSQDDRPTAVLALNDVSEVQGGEGAEGCPGDEIVFLQVHAYRNTIEDNYSSVKRISQQSK